jgi:gliding motility-associated peptidyl-prolyl isomerase
MKEHKLLIIVLFAFLLVSSCKQNQEARKPLSQTSGSFMKKSIARNKKLVAGEEVQIDSVIKGNPKIKFQAAKNGFWYTYIEQNKLDTLTPKKGDVVFFNYEIKDLKGNIIYSELELGPQTYAIDKQNIMTGLREGIKLMHKNEKVNFLFPSHIAYGYHGDEKKIGPNQPLSCTLTLHNFIDEKAFQKNIQLKNNPIITNNKDTLKTKK